MEREQFNPDENFDQIEIQNLFDGIRRYKSQTKCILIEQSRSTVNKTIGLDYYHGSIYS